MAIIRGTYVTRLSGKVGDVVYRMRDGQNIASQKASVVKNPRTDAQQTQRMIMATVSAAYSAMKAICDHSFEGITYGSKTMGEFMRRNLAIMKSRQEGFNLKGNPYMMPNPLIISKGSLPTIPVYSVAAYQHSVEIELGVNAPAEAAALTVEQLHSALGIQIGDQITICALGTNENSTAVETEQVVQNQSNFAYSRLVFKTSSGTSTVLNSGNINVSALDTEASENYSIIGIKVTAANDPITFSVSVPDMNDTSGQGCAGTVIISRKTGSSWLRSTQTLSIENNEFSTREYVLPSYSPSGNKYLNNAII